MRKQQIIINSLIIRFAINKAFAGVLLRKNYIKISYFRKGDKNPATTKNYPALQHITSYKKGDKKPKIL